MNECPEISREMTVLVELKQSSNSRDKQPSHSDAIDNAHVPLIPFDSNAPFFAYQANTMT